VGKRVNIHPTGIPGVVVVDSARFEDARGSFGRLFCASELKPVIGERNIVQINHSCTHAVGAVRGMHFQFPPAAEMKLVRCLRGRVWDIAVDLRTGSATFLKWHAEELTSGNHRMMVVPEGCAHGFQVLEPDSELLYLHTAFYTPASEGGVRHDDPALAIRWPLPVTDLSARDAAHPPITNDFTGITL
jgi:dTDP-4-dehydrorhamnose 3,5-epimerase